jgi:hypothetical protein
MMLSTSLASGDVVEIETPSGLAFVQVTHHHVSYPEILRALAGPMPARPNDIEMLARLPSRFVAMFPLSDALARMGFPGRRVGAAAIPDAAKPFPTFSMPIRDKIDGIRGEIAYWWLWNGDGLTYTSAPPQEVGCLPERKVLTLDELVSRLGESGTG